MHTFMHVSVCVCVCVHGYALRIISTDKILHFINTLITIIINLIKLGGGGGGVPRNTDGVVKLGRQRIHSKGSYFLLKRNKHWDHI